MHTILHLLLARGMVVPLILVIGALLTGPDVRADRRRRRAVRRGRR